jgi:hypothetical protein
MQDNAAEQCEEHTGQKKACPARAGHQQGCGNKEFDGHHNTAH